MPRAKPKQHPVLLSPRSRDHQEVARVKALIKEKLQSADRHLNAAKKELVAVEKMAALYPRHDFLSV